MGAKDLFFMGLLLFVSESIWSKGAFLNEHQQRMLSDPEYIRAQFPHAQEVLVKEESFSKEGKDYNVIESSLVLSTPPWIQKIARAVSVRDSIRPTLSSVSAERGFVPAPVEQSVSYSEQEHSKPPRAISLLPTLHPSFAQALNSRGESRSPFTVSIQPAATHRMLALKPPDPAEFNWVVLSDRGKEYLSPLSPRDFSMLVPVIFQCW